MFMPRPIAKSVDTIARQAVGKDWSLYSALLEHWREIVGPEYARVTTPVKITFPLQPNAAKRHGGTLCIRLPKGLAMEFSFMTEQIRQRINTYFGHEAVFRIVFEPVYYAQPDRLEPDFEPSPEAIASIHETAASIEDDELRDALTGFGEAVLKSSNGC